MAGIAGLPRTHASTASDPPALVAMHMSTKCYVCMHACDCVSTGGAPRPMSAPSPRARRAAQQHGGDDTASQVPVPQPLEPVEEGEPGELELLAELPVWVDSPTRHTPAAETPRLQPQPGALNPITPVALH
jgi:hypothetical protein